MLRKELVLGFVVAGFLATAVPTSVFETVFVTGHGFASDLENVVVAPIAAFLSFVCSVGNVPLAAALYSGGLTFGGTVAFIFADLLTIPLVLIYARFYGRRLAVRLALAFWVVMSVAGLAVDLLFRLVRIPAPERRDEVVERGISFNYTTVLNAVFLLVALAVYVTYRNRGRLGGGQDYAQDPVCGMQVEKANPGAATEHDSRSVFFCSDKCKTRSSRTRASTWLRLRTRRPTSPPAPGRRARGPGLAQVTNR